MTPYAKSLLIAFVLTVSNTLSAAVLNTNNQIYKDTISSFVWNKINQCMNEIPNGQGLLVHIDSNFSPPSLPQQKQQKSYNFFDENKLQKRYIPKLIKEWKKLPVEQKWSVFGTSSGLLSVIAFGTNAAQTFDSEQISNIKSKAALHEVEKGMLKGKRKDDKESEKDKNNRNKSKHTKVLKTIIPPPPLLSIVHVKRSFVKRGIGSDEKMIESKLKNSTSFTKKLLNHSHSPTHSPPHSNNHYSSANSHFSNGNKNHQKIHSIVHSSSNPIINSQSEGIKSSERSEKQKQEKKPNQTLNKILTWTNQSMNMIYIPIALMTLHRVQRVQDDDTKSYRKRDLILSILPKEFFPTINCIPILKEGKEDFIIPKGALQYQ